MPEEATQRWIIEDWTSRRLFPEHTFASFQDGWTFIYENVKEDECDDHTYDDYYVVPAR